jgi:peroxiredoxin family protein
MGILNIARDELVDSVDMSMGMVEFMNLVKEVDLTVFI